MTAFREETPVEAVRAMRARGLDDPESLLQFCSPAAILAACDWWDSKPNVRPGLLAWRIKGGGVEPADGQPRTKRQELHARFVERAKLFPPCSVIETHADLQRRLWPDDERCAGRMVVLAATFPAIEAECDACNFEAAYPLAAVPERPAQTGVPRPEPPAAPAGKWPAALDSSGRVQRWRPPTEPPSAEAAS